MTRGRLGRLRRCAGALAWALAGGLACRSPASAEPEPQAQPVDEGPPLEPEQPTNRSEGEALELALPGVDGETIELAALRGRVVILALTSVHAPSYPALLALLRRLRSEAPASTELVLVASDREGEDLDEDAMDLLFCWDPQGAVAAKLAVARFPTVLVLDPDGHIVAALGAYEPKEDGNGELAAAVLRAHAAGAAAAAAPTP